MDIRQLKYFLAIAEEGQITAAARKLQMAQPPLSQQLKLLEDELGVKLVERGPRSIQLTDAGAVLRNRAEQILELADSAEREIRDLAAGEGGTLAIGTVSSSGAILLQEALADFHQQHQKVKYELYEGNTFAILDLLAKGIIEVGIVRTPFHDTHLGCRYAESEPMLAVMGAAHDWAPEETEITVDALRDKPLILYRRFEPLIRETCRKEGFEPHILCKNDDARTTLFWANAGLGIGIVPASALRLADSSNLRSKTMLSADLRTQVAAVWVKERYLSSLASRFLECFGEA